MLAVAAGALLAVSGGVLLWRASRPRGGFEVAENAFSIYLLGGSTAQGYPYFPRLNLGKIVRLLVGGQIDGFPIRVVNLAGPGKTARVTLRDSRDLVDHRPPRGRSLAFLYVGNNEFTRFDRRHDLRVPERTLFDAVVVSPDEKALVESRYGLALEKIIGMLQDAGLMVVASTAAVNLEDWEPNRSVLADPAHADTMRTLLAAGDRALAAGDPAAALAHFERALALEPRFALAWKRAGDCCRVLHRSAQARRHYRNAVDHDGNPLRETSELDAILRRVCARRQVPLLDAAVVLGEASPDSLLGFELLWDQCHPTFEGYVLLGRVFATVLDSLYHVAPRPISSAEIRTELEFDPGFEQQVLNLEGQACYVASTLTFDPAPRLARARLYLERADALGPDVEVACSLAVLAALEGDVQSSLAHWRRARGLDAKAARRRMENRYVVQIMVRHGIEDLDKATR